MIFYAWMFPITAKFIKTFIEGKRSILKFNIRARWASDTFWTKDKIWWQGISQLLPWWKVSKYGPEKAPYLDTFPTVPDV